MARVEGVSYSGRYGGGAKYGARCRWVLANLGNMGHVANKWLISRLIVVNMW